MDASGLNLASLVQSSEGLCALQRKDLQAGDLVYVKTCNSLYCIHVEDQSSFNVTGGWFDRNGSVPVRTSIAGCTWGGSIIKVDIIAAIGLSLEFGNRVTTSAIRQIVVLRRERRN